MKYIRTLVLSLAMAVLAICAACSLHEEDDGPVIHGRDSASTDHLDKRESPRPITPVEMDELWAELSKDEQKLLEEHHLGKAFWDRQADPPDPGEMWDNMDAANRAVYEEGGTDREKFVENQLNMRRMLDKEHYRMQIERYITQYSPLETLKQAANVGKPLEWRSLHEIPTRIVDSDFNSPRMVVGNLDSDADPELMLVSDGVYFIEMDGTAHKPQQFQGQHCRTLWDYDGDGLDEVLAHVPADKADESGVMLAVNGVFNLQGELLGKIGGELVPPWGREGDLDGDGEPELLSVENLIGSKPQQLLATRRGGEVVFREEVMAWAYCIPGDIDGDGLDEMLVKMPQGHPYSLETRFIELGGNRVQTKSDSGEVENDWQLGTDFIEACGHMVGEEVFALEDVNGDGREDVICNEKIYLSWNSKVLELEMPEGYSFQSWAGQKVPTILLLKHGNERRLAALLVYGDERNRSQTLAIWNAAGGLDYLEHFGEEIFQLASSADSRHLFALTQSKLSIVELH